MFYYRAGDVSTTIGWLRPTKKSFNLWFDEWRTTVKLSNYNVYLTGGFCEKCFTNEERETWDVDIVLAPVEISDVKYDELKNILDQAMYIGFKHRLFIDIWYNAKAPYDFSSNKENIDNPSNSIINYSETQMITDGEEFNDILEDGIEIIPGLYEVVNYNIEEVKRKSNKLGKVPYRKVDDVLL